MQNIKIEGNFIYLRKLKEKDATRKYVGWLNDPEVNRYLETRKISVGELRNYIKEKNKNHNCLFLGIFLKENNNHIGNVKLEPIDHSNKKATFGILIGDKNYWGKGIGTEVTKVVVNHALFDLGLKKVELGVISQNRAAIKVYKKVGFLIISREKKALKHGTKFYDKIVMSYCKTETRKANERKKR